MSSCALTVPPHSKQTHISRSVGSEAELFKTEFEQQNTQLRPQSSDVSDARVWIEFHEVFDKLLKMCKCNSRVKAEVCISRTDIS